MPTRARDRRGDRIRGEIGLLERGLELDAIDELLRSSGDGADHALLITGHPGLGKTRLFGIALDRARAGGMLVLRAAGSELEQNFAFGVAGQLLRCLLATVPASERDALLSEMPERVRALYEGGAALGPTGVEEGLSISHGLLTVLAGAVETRPALVAIDDLHWTDEASLGFVLYMLHRLAELRVALLMTSRPSDADGDALGAVAVHPSVRVAELVPLGPGAVAELVTGTLGREQAGALGEVCMEVTAGNPFYLHELLLALAEGRGDSVERLEHRARRQAPNAVTRTARMRIGRLGRDAAALARATAILGDDVPLRNAAALAGLDVKAAGAAADALASVQVLVAREPLRFVHPLVRTAVQDDMPASERASRHLVAARLLAAEGEDVERVAAHLLLGRPEGDAWAVEQLRAAAADARSRGAAASAVRYIERALSEPPSSVRRTDLLVELGDAEAALGLADAEEHLVLAARETDDPVRRAEIALLRGGALYARGLAEPAVSAYQNGLDQLVDAPPDARGRELRDRLQTGWLLSAVTLPSLQAEARRLSAEVMNHDSAGLPSHSQRVLLAQATVEAAFGGRPAEVVIDLATRAWDQGRLLEDQTSHGASWLMVTAALCLSGDLERSLETAEAAAADARQRSAPLAFATASYLRVLPQLWQGNIDGALADLELARDARRYGWRQYVRSAAAQYCLCMIEKGEFSAADEVLVEDAPLEPPYDGEDAIRLYALAELRRTQGRYEEAFEVALTAGLAAEAAFSYLGYCPWRCSAAESALAMGQPDTAGELVRQELERLETTQVLHERIRALRLAGMCEGGEAGLTKLLEAVELGEAHPPRLETIHALIAFGSTLRRRNQRSAARSPLERAFDLTRRGGATALHELARTELAATGAHPRRDALSGPESLTPSERRVADLAADGLGNRQIAQTLFVTPKTVEYHLRNAYRKLDIQTRRELADALGT